MRIQHGGALARQSPDAQAVGAVGQHLEVHNVVAQAEDVLYVGAGGVFLVENEDALLAAVGVQAGGNVQLRAGAEHTV